MFGIELVLAWIAGCVAGTVAGNWENQFPEKVPRWEGFGGELPPGPYLFLSEELALLAQITWANQTFTQVEDSDPITVYAALDFRRRGLITDELGDHTETILRTAAKRAKDLEYGYRVHYFGRADY